MKLFERSVGVIFLIQPRGASLANPTICCTRCKNSNKFGFSSLAILFAAPCSKQIGLEWQNLYKRVKHKVYFEVLQRAQLSFAEGSANDEQGILNKFNSRAEE